MPPRKGRGGRPSSFQAGTVGQGKSGKLSCRAHFLEATQKSCIDEYSENYSSVLLKPGDVVVMESGYAIPHQSNKRSVKATAAAAQDYNAVLVYFKAAVREADI